MGELAGELRGTKEKGENEEGERRT